MIYSANLTEMAGKINHIDLSKYVSDLNWKKYEGRLKQGIAVYQKTIDNELYQITIPCDRNLYDYDFAMRQVIETLSFTENKSEEQLILELLNPLSDILRVRHISPSVDNGSILFEDAINLFENSKKLLLNATLDCYNYKRIYRGRAPENVQQFINNCRYGQTEIGSYVISLVCPFMSLADGGIQQLSIFTDEEESAFSITRKATKKLIESIAEIKEIIDNGNDLSEIIEDPEKKISVSFVESLSNLNINKENNSLEINATWAPTIRQNKPKITKIEISHDYYAPLKSVVDRYKREDEATTNIIEGRISKLNASPNIEERKNGKATLVYINNESKAKKITLDLTKDDYDIAILAHSEGKTIRARGEISGNDMSVNTIEIL